MLTMLRSTVFTHVKIWGWASFRKKEREENCLRKGCFGTPAFG